MGYYKNLGDKRAEVRRYNAAVRRAERLTGTADASRLIKLETVSETERYQMAKDADRATAFNRDVERWAENISRMLRLKIQSRSQTVARELHANFYTDDYGLVHRIGFSFPRHGIYIHKGAGRGQGGWIGSKRETLKTVGGVQVGTGIVRHTDPQSLGKQGTGNRRAYPWFDSTLRAHIHELEQIATDYFDTMIIDATNIYVDK